MQQQVRNTKRYQFLKYELQRKFKLSKRCDEVGEQRAEIDASRAFRKEIVREPETRSQLKSQEQTCMAGIRGEKKEERSTFTAISSFRYLTAHVVCVTNDNPCRFGS